MQTESIVKMQRCSVIWIIRLWKDEDPAEAEDDENSAETVSVGR